MMLPEHLGILAVIRGAPASILFALLLHQTGAGQDSPRPALGAKDLARHTLWSDTQITEALKILAEMGLIENRARYHGWSLTERACTLLRLGLERAGENLKRAGASPTPTAAPAQEPGGAPAGSPTPLDSSLLEEVNCSSLNQEELTAPDSQAAESEPAAAAGQIRQILAATRDLFGEPVLGGPERYPDLQRLLGWIAQAYARRGELRKPARVAYTNLKNGLDPEPEFLADPQRYLPPAFLRRAGLGGDPEAEAAAGREDAAEETSRAEETGLVEEGYAPEEGGAPAGSQRTAGSAASWSEGIWGQALEVLRSELPQAAFERYLAPARLAGCDPGSGDLLVQAADPYGREWLEQRLGARLNRLLRGAAGRRVEARFVVGE